MRFSGGISKSTLEWKTINICKISTLCKHGANDLSRGVFASTHTLVLKTWLTSIYASQMHHKENRKLGGQLV